MHEELDRCPLCDYRGPRLIDLDLGNGFDVKCPRCGHFIILRNLLPTLKSPANLSNNKRPYLSAHTRQSSAVTMLHLENWEELAYSHANTSVEVKVEKLLNLLSQKTSVPGDYVKLDEDFDYPVIDAASANELQFYRKHLKALGYIEDVDEAVRLTVKGWARLQVPPGGFPGRSFVAMSFDDSLADAFELGIKPAVHIDCRLPEPIRIDRQEHNEKICDKILATIRTCQFVVADFTLQRAGVYFEAGFAMGLGRTVVWSCREDDFDKLHFDTRQYNHIKWTSPGDLREKLADRIQATIAI